MEKSKRIPIGLLQKGIEFCRVNALAYLDDARMILSKGRFGHAHVSVQLAIEELGKAIILREKRDEAYKKPRMGYVKVESRLFGGPGSHKYKTEKAWTLLDPKSKTIHKRMPRLEGANTEASHSTRLECAYVDFHEESQLWWLGPVIDKPELEALIENIEEVLDQSS